LEGLVKGDIEEGGDSEVAMIISSTSSRDEARLMFPASKEELPFALKGDENVGNGGYVRGVELDARVGAVVVVAIIELDEDDSKLFDLATILFDLVEDPPIGISTDNEDDEFPVFIFFFPFSCPLPPSFASCNSFSSCLLFKAFKLDSKDIPAGLSL
jgi:hypothetical protein